MSELPTDAEVISILQRENKQLKTEVKDFTRLHDDCLVMLNHSNKVITVLEKLIIGGLRG